MRRKDILRFDETNAALVQALQERCLQGGHVVYAMQKKHGWSPSDVSGTAETFGVNMTIDDRFPSEQFRLEVLGGSAYWWKWVRAYGGMVA